MATTVGNIVRLSRAGFVLAQHGVDFVPVGTKAPLALHVARALTLPIRALTWPFRAARPKASRVATALASEAIDEHLGSDASYAQPLGGGHVWLTLNLTLNERELVEETARNGVAYVPGGAMTIERGRDVSMRLSFGYLEPDELVEGVRRIAQSARALSRRPARREVVPV